jgi:trehalose 6-phosphate phosphatase
MKTFASHGALPAMHHKLSDFWQVISRAGRHVLILDYDGTLAPFSQERECAAPYSMLLPLLELLQHETDTRLVVVTGRPASSAARLLRLPDVEIWGCHGLERLQVDGSLDKPEVAGESLQAIADATELLLEDGLGQFAERKFASIAIHWRGKEALAGQLTRRVLRVWSIVQHRKGVRLLPFDGGLEITVGARNRGDAVQTMLSENGPDAAVAYLGGETPDEDAFGALHGRGLSVLVREEYRRTVADVWIRPPTEVAAFLKSWASACNTRD